MQIKRMKERERGKSLRMTTLNPVLWNNKQPQKKIAVRLPNSLFCSVVQPVTSWPALLKAFLS